MLDQLKNQLGGAKMAARKMIGNFVAIDEIHKDHVKKEQVAHKNWQKNHGYMIDEIYKVSKLAKNAAFPISLMLIFNHQ